MKYYFFLLIFLLSNSLFAQDLIILKTGDEIQAKVIKVGTQEVEYKKWTNQKGPVYTLEKDDIFMIKYQNGDKDVFQGNSSSGSEAVKGGNNDPKYVNMPPSSENSSIIAQYNKQYAIGKKWKLSKKVLSSCLTIYGVTSTSVMSNDDMEISIEHNPYELLYYNIVIKNKSNRVLYVDKGNSFRVTKDENYCYYNSGTQVTTSSGGGLGLSMGLGGLANAIGMGGVAGAIANSVSVGGGTSHSTGVAYGQQRFIVLPPKGQATLAKDYKVEKKLLEKDECFAFLFDNVKPKVNEGAVLNFDESNSPHTVDYIICYSGNQNFTEYSTMNIRLYAKQIVGTPFSSSSYNGFGEGTNSVVERRIQDIDKYCIIGCLCSPNTIQCIESQKESNWRIPK